MRKRNKITYASLFVSAMLWILLDPNQGFVQDLPIGSSLAVVLLYASKVTFLWTAVHYMRKSMFDYIDFNSLVRKATETPVGAGLACVSIGLVLIAASLVALAAMSS
jgi:uncharacterized membrane protein